MSSQVRKASNGHFSSGMENEFDDFVNLYCSLKMFEDEI